MEMTCLVGDGADSDVAYCRIHHGYPYTRSDTRWCYPCNDLWKTSTIKFSQCIKIVILLTCRMSTSLVWIESSYSGSVYFVRRIIRTRGINCKNKRLTNGDMTCVDDDLKDLSNWILDAFRISIFGSILVNSKDLNSDYRNFTTLMK